jgi:hypothetical protein
MATAVTDMEAVLVLNLTFYLPSRDRRRKPITVRTIPRTVLPPITLEGGYDKGRTPRTRGFGLIDPYSTWPRPTISQQGGKADVAQDSGSFHRLILYVTMVSRDGRPFPGHVAIATSTGIDKTSPLRHPQHPSILLLYKRAGRGSTRGQARSQNTSQSVSEAKAEEQQITDRERPISFVLPFSL